MKRIWIAIAVCILLLAVSATGLAETRWDYHLEWTSDPGAVSTYLELVLQDQDQAKILAELCENVLNESILSGYIQKDAFSVSWYYDDEEYLGVSAVQNGDALDVRTSLAPDAVIRFPATYTSDANQDGLAAHAEMLNVEKVLQWVRQFLSDPPENLSIRREDGRFAGDAYTGGTHCVTLECRESDLPGILIGYLSDTAGAEEATEWLRELESMLADSTYHYKVCYVTAQDQWVGLSFTAFDQDEQVLTLSVGRGEEQNELRLVMGFGQYDQNYYVQCLLSGSREESAGMTTVNGYLDANVYTDPYAVGYQALMAWDYSQVQRYTAELTVHDAGDLMASDLQIRQYEGDKVFLQENVKTGYMKQAGAMVTNSELYVGESELSLLQTVFRMNQVLSPEHVESGAQEQVYIMDTEHPDQVDETLMQQLQSGFQKLMIRVFKLLPPEFLRLFM